MPENKLRQLISHVDRLYAGRADLSKVADSVELLKRGTDDCFEGAWRLSRALFFLGQEIPEQARSFHANGVEAGQQAATLEAKRVEGHFWLGVNLALLAQTEGPLRAIIDALKARRALRRAIAIDCEYHAAGPLRALGRLEHKLPRWLGGSRKRARASFEQAIRIAPANTVTRTYFAELLIDAGAMADARSELEFVVNAPVNPDWIFETERDQRLAQGMIAKLGDADQCCSN